VTPPDRVFEPEAILRALLDHRVDFVARPNALNLSRLSEALAQLEAEPRGSGAVNLADPHQLRNAAVIPIMTIAGPLDLLNTEHLAGATRGYDALLRGALVIEVPEGQVAVVGLSDLIRMKRAAGREHDLADIEALTRRPDDRVDGRGEST
jgi:hypothetical protein